MKLLKKLFLLSLFLLSLSCFSQEKFNLEIGINSLNGWMMDNKFYSYHLNNRYYTNYLEGLNLNLSKEVLRKDLAVFIGGLILHKNYLNSNFSEIADYKIRGGGIYAGIEFFPTIFRINKEKEQDVIALSSSFAVGNFAFMENLILINNSDAYGDPIYAINEQNSSNSFGTILSIGPKIIKGRGSFKLLAKAIVTGNNDLNVTAVGINASLGFKF